MSNFKVKTRIFSSFVIIAILLLVLSYISIDSSNSAKNALEEIEHINLKVTQDFTSFHEIVDEMEVILFRTSASRDKSDDSYIVKIEELFKDGNNLLSELRSSLEKYDFLEKENIFEIIGQLTEEFKVFKERGILMTKAYIRSGHNVGNMFLRQTAEDTEKFKEKIHNLAETNIEKLNLRILEIENGSNVTIRTSMIVAIISVILVIIFGLRLSNSISNPISYVVDCTKVMAQGDLTKRLDVSKKAEEKSNNETDRLSVNFNRFANSLCKIIEKISLLSNKNSEVKNELLNNTEMVVSAVSEISANISSINKQVENLDNSIDQSASASDKIKVSTATFKESFNKQIEMEEDSNSAITQMAASINNVAAITKDKKRVIDNLNKTAQNGNSRLQSTIKVINDIAESVEKINEMVALIDSISSQTNLLSMNAAIEAAHAGEVGKGFAVVADEIGKLADSSKNSLETISSTIARVSESINEAVYAGNETEEAFKQINSGINEVTLALDEISASTDELNIGSNMILESIGNLQDISSTVKDESIEMIKNSETVTTSMDSVKEISHQVTSSISEIRVGMKDISDSMIKLESLSDNMGHITDDLNKEISNFKVKK